MLVATQDIKKGEEITWNYKPYLIPNNAPKFLEID
jgi:SET domain-containing protein